MTSLRKLAVALIITAFILGTSAMHAGTKETKNNRAIKKERTKVCLVRFGSSAIPEPCDRLHEMPSTAEPMRILGNLPTARD